MVSPYRTPRPSDSARNPPRAPADACPDVDLAIVGALLWVVSLVTVVSAVERSAPSAEAALATVTVVGLPWLARPILAWAARRLFARGTP